MRPALKVLFWGSNACAYYVDFVGLARKLREKKREFPRAFSYCGCARCNVTLSLFGKECRVFFEAVVFLKRAEKMFASLFLSGCMLILMSGCWTWTAKNEAPGADDQAVYVPEGEPTIKSGLTLRVGVTASGSAAVADEAKEVNANGEILMPLIGAVKCEGLTIVELQEKIKAAYKAYFIEPQVTVGFLYQENAGMKSPWGSVLVTGEVGHPGPVNMSATRELTVTRALMLAGGTTAVADKRNVRVTRREKTGALKRFNVDIDLIGKEGRTDLDIALKPGDVIWVPESWY
jgi:protein involved in polysaccharide export with SLBB domain